MSGRRSSRTMAPCDSRHMRCTRPPSNLCPTDMAFRRYPADVLHRRAHCFWADVGMVDRNSRRLRYGSGWIVVMGADYWIVILFAIPFGHVPSGNQEWGMIPTSDIVEARRRRLREWIALHHGGVQKAFIDATGINQGELSALLKDKSFGEKRARSIERMAHMPPGYLVSPKTTATHGTMLQDERAGYGPAVHSLDTQRLQRAFNYAVEAFDRFELIPSKSLLLDAASLIYERVGLGVAERTAQKELDDVLARARSTDISIKEAIHASRQSA